MRCMVLLDHGFCALCYEARRGRGHGHRRRRPVAVLEVTGIDWEIEAMKRPDAIESGGGGSPLVDEVLAGWLPTLLEYLATMKWEDGKPRKTSTAMIFVDQGRLKVCIHDRDLRRSCFVTGESWEEVWEATERGLKQDTVEWRKDTR